MFNPDYSDLLKLFTENSVNYVVVGAYAMAAHGYVRATGDIDILVQPTHENASAVRPRNRGFVFDGSSCCFSDKTILMSSPVPRPERPRLPSALLGVQLVLPLSE